MVGGERMSEKFRLLVKNPTKSKIHLARNECVGRFCHHVFCHGFVLHEAPLYKCEAFKLLVDPFEKIQKSKSLW